MIGNTLYAPITIKSPPQTPSDFDSLFRRLKEDNIPFRIRFDLSDNGMGLLTFKESLAAILQITGGSTNNKFLVGVTQKLRAAMEAGQSIVKFKISICTWAQNGNYDLLELRKSKIVKSLLSWGQTEAQDVEGDPLEAFMSSVPFATMGSISPPCATPLYEALKIVPITRQGSPWSSGSQPFRTVDGKLFHYQPVSEKQAYWISLFSGAMGGGKSVAMNSSNWALVHHPKNDELPYISIIDIGPSSKGLIDIVRNSLPKEQKHLAIYVRMQNTAKYQINNFDTPLGLRYPLSDHKGYLVNFLSFLCMNTEVNRVPECVPGILINMIDLAYKRCADRKYAFGYKPNVVKEVDEYLSSSDFDTSAPMIKWFDVTDYLTLNGELDLARKTHSHAVPELPMLITLASDERITAETKNITLPSGEKANEYIKRKLTEAMRIYPVIAGRTKLDLHDSRIISLDLNDVAQGGGEQAGRQKALMYLLAYNILTNKFQVTDESLDEMEGPVGRYNVDYRVIQKQRIDAMKRAVKRFCIDEKHNVNDFPIVDEQLDSAALQARKWKIEIQQASQSITAFSKTYRDYASSVFIQSVGSEDDINDLKTTFGLNASILYHLRNSLKKPSRKGSTFVGLFKGFCAHPLEMNLKVIYWPFISYDGVK